MRALDGGKDGLDVILPILKYSVNHLNPENPDSRLYLETDPCHSLLLPQVLAEQHPDLKIEVERVVQDFNGKERLLVLKRS